MKRAFVLIKKTISYKNRELIYFFVPVDEEKEL